MNLRDELLGQGIATVFGKTNRLRIWWTSIPQGSLMAQMAKNLTAVWETQVRSLGWEVPLETGMATHSSVLARKIS